MATRQPKKWFGKSYAFENPTWNLKVMISTRKLLVLFIFSFHFTFWGGGIKWVNLRYFPLFSLPKEIAIYILSSVVCLWNMPTSPQNTRSTGRMESFNPIDLVGAQRAPNQMLIYSLFSRENGHLGCSWMLITIRTAQLIPFLKVTKRYNYIHDSDDLPASVDPPLPDLSAFLPPMTQPQSPPQQQRRRRHPPPPQTTTTTTTTTKKKTSIKTHFQQNLSETHDMILSKQAQLLRLLPVWYLQSFPVTAVCASCSRLVVGNAGRDDMMGGETALPISRICPPRSLLVGGFNPSQKYYLVKMGIFLK